MTLPKNNNLNHKELSYLQSFLIVTGLMVIGFVIQFLFGSINFGLLQFPKNLLILLIIIVLIIVGHFKFKKSIVVIWLSSIKAAISSIVGFSFISLLMGFITQAETTNKYVTHLGLNNIAYSWVYVLVFLLLVLSLGFATAKRLYPLKKSNFWFILNHLGLWITIVAANFGFADQTHLRMNINTTSYNNYAVGEKGDFLILPFELKQTNFKLVNYNPKLTIMDSKTSMLSLKSGKNTIEAKNQNLLTIENWSIKILRYYESARSIGDSIQPFDSLGSAPAAYVLVENLISKEQKKGWISSGNELLPEQSLLLDNQHPLIMIAPVEKEMKLGISIKTGNKEISRTIAINSPLTLQGWKMYIVSFDKQKGKWSNSSVVELVNDPWQPFVYLGLTMMIIGSFFVFWRGKK